MFRILVQFTPFAHLADCIGTILQDANDLQATLDRCSELGKFSPHGAISKRLPSLSPRMKLISILMNYSHSTETVISIFQFILVQFCGAHASLQRLQLQCGRALSRSRQTWPGAAATRSCNFDGAKNPACEPAATAR